MTVFQFKNGYRYNSDSLTLYYFINKNLPLYFRASVLEVGCGCGVIGLLIARDYKNINLSLLDIQEKNIEISRLNFKENNLDAIFIQEDFKEFKSSFKFDLIVSNPPFYSQSNSENEHKKISRNSSFLPLFDFLNKSNSILNPNGELIFCYSPDYIQEIFSICKNLKLKIISMVSVHPKIDKSSNLIIIRAKKSSKSPCNIYPAIILNDKSREISNITNLLSKDLDGI